MPAPPTSQCKKIFARNVFSGVLKRRMRRKTRESVQVIRYDDTFADRARRCRAADFGSDSSCEERAKRSRACAGGSDTPLRSDADLLLEQVVDGLRVGLAARRLHPLADDPADRFRVRFGVGDLVGVLSDDVVDDLFERGEVGHLLETTLFDD